MSIIKEVRGFTPEFGKDCYFAETSIIIGNVKAGDQCSFWFNSVVRGDVNSIRLGNKVNVQDGAVIHCTYERAATEIGNNVSIGHNALVHGCTIADNVLVGMGSIIMDLAEVQSEVLIAAGSVVLEKTVLESGHLYAGTPARKIKKLDTRLFEGEVMRIAKNYIKYSSWYK